MTLHRCLNLSCCSCHRCNDGIHFATHSRQCVAQCHCRFDSAVAGYQRRDHHLGISSRAIIFGFLQHQCVFVQEELHSNPYICISNGPRWNGLDGTGGILFISLRMGVQFEYDIWQHSVSYRYALCLICGTQCSTQYISVFMSSNMTTTQTPSP